MIDKFVAQILASMIRSQGLNFLATLIFNFILKFLELFKGFRLVPHQVGISISTKIISKSYEVLVPSSGCRAHWSTYIGMYKSNKSNALSGKPVKGALVILPSK